MSRVRALAEALPGALRMSSVHPVPETEPGQRRSGADAPVESRLALPRFLDVTKAIPISHAEISALYFVVEDFEEQVRGSDPADPTAEAERLASLLQGVVRRWNEAEPNVYADLIELPWDA